jgi:RNA polymerase sigma-70 factor (ECF subfamily)
MTSDQQWLADRFEQARPQLRSVAYSMLGSHAEADDAVQESWLRLARVDGDGIDNVTAWLTTVVGRICLDMLRARRTRREDYLGTWLPEPSVATDASDPEQSALAADAIGIALLVVLETLAPRERLAFVLHDVFGVDYEQIAPIVDRTPEATRQLASRARRRVRAAPPPDPDLARQRAIADAFVAAATGRDVDRLLELLDPDVTFRIDFGPAGPAPALARLRTPLVGAQAVARNALSNAPRFLSGATRATVNGGPGLLLGDPNNPIAVAALTVVADRITHIDVVADPAKLRTMRRDD